MKIISRVLLASSFLLFCNGCIVQRVMDSQDRQHYSEYLAAADKTNLERQKAGLNPQPPLSFNEWRGDTKK